MRGNNVPSPITSFAVAGLPEYVEKEIANQKFSEPTPIQAQGWPIALSGHNMVGIAQTGSGKTVCNLMNQNGTRNDFYCRKNLSKDQIKYSLTWFLIF